MAQDSKVSMTPYMDAVTQNFIKAVKDKGMTHVMQWMDEWYAKEAEASLRDEVHQAMSSRMDAMGRGGRWGTMHARQEASHALTKLVALRHLLSTDPSQQSSQAGSTQRNRSIAAAALKLLKESDCAISARSSEELLAQVDSLFKKHYEPPKGAASTSALRVTQGTLADRRDTSDDTSSTNLLLMTAASHVSICDSSPSYSSSSSSYSSSSSDSGSSSSDCSGGGGD